MATKKRKAPAWKRALNKKDLAHCRAEGMTSIAALKRTRDHQNKMKGDGFGYPCRECFDIFHKLDEAGIKLILK